MFDKLKNAFSNVSKGFSEKELNEKDIDDVLFELEIALLESDVATEVTDEIKTELKKRLVGSKVDKNEIQNFVKASLIQIISNLFDEAGTIDIVQKILDKKDSPDPYIILFVGINGTGKTTTLAKMGYMLQQNKISVVIAAADTFRAGAIEQLKEHAKRINLKVVAQNYGSDPAAVCRDAVLYAKSHQIDCVLIDTAGRMQTSKNLMDQITKISNVVKPDLKIFVGDSLAGNDTVNQAREFHNHTKFDASILTKSDADARGGAALSIVKITSTPILFIGMGQEYKDIKPFDKETFLETVFGVHQKVPESTPETKPKVEQDLKSEQEAKSKPEPEKSEEKKPEPAAKTEVRKQEPKEEIPVEEKEEPLDEDDPFAGVDTKDINKYADLYDVPPPENDKEARDMANKIRKWISDGRPKPGEGPKKRDEEDKPEKKRSFFGRFRK